MLKTEQFLTSLKKMDASIKYDYIVSKLPVIKRCSEIFAGETGNPQLYFTKLSAEDQSNDFRETITFIQYPHIVLKKKPDMVTLLRKFDHVAGNDGCEQNHIL